MFEYRRSVHFYETDLMRIVHHGNYLRFYEEARVAWGVACGVIDLVRPETAAAFAVLGTQVKHLKALRFGDPIRIDLQVRLIGVRIVFEYKMWKDSELVSEARTEHVNLDENMKIQRPTAEVKRAMEKEKWNETWLLNL